MPDELDPLLPPSPKRRRPLGLFGAAFLIFNRIIGTGIYATPSNILRSSGSVGISFVMWLVGAFIAACGTAVYIELGTGLPKNGGEKNYLEYMYRRPKYLVTCAFAVYTLIMGTATANSVVFAEYLLHALSTPPTWTNTRLLAFLCLTFILLMHGTLLKWGVRLQNALGFLKLVVLALICLSGLLSLAGVKGVQVREPYERPDNLRWSKLWEGSSGVGVNSFVGGLYNVIWSFIGYANANYALSEVENPVRTIKRAAPLAVFCVSTVYLFINVAYYAVVSKKDILESRRIVAALYFRNLFGETTERALSAFIAVSTLGNLLAGQFAQGRVIQELGRSGILPLSSFLASSRPFDAPLAGLFAQYLVSCTFLFGVPPGDAYLFLISLSSYALTLINTLITLGLILLYTPLPSMSSLSFLTPSTNAKTIKWNPPYKAPKAIVYAFLGSNLFLAVVPFVPPPEGKKGYERLSYWSHSLGGILISLIGVAYWWVWTVWKPRVGGYRLRRVWVPDGYGAEDDSSVARGDLDENIEGAGDVGRRRGDGEEDEGWRDRDRDEEGGDGEEQAGAEDKSEGRWVFREIPLSEDDLIRTRRRWRDVRDD